MSVSTTVFQAASSFNRATVRRELTIKPPIHLAVFFARSLVPNEIQFAPRHFSVSFLHLRYASAFHLARLSCHLLRRATLSASVLTAAHRCTAASRRDATRHAVPYGCTAARHADRWYSRCDARPLSIFVRHWNPRRILSSAFPNVLRKQSRFAEFAN